MIPQTPKRDPDHSAYDRFKKLRCGRGCGLVQQLTKFPFTAVSNMKSHDVVMGILNSHRLL